MSRFTVYQEIAVIKAKRDLTYGKIYTVYDVMDGYAIILDDVGDATCLSDDEAITREEYEQAERERDPFAPGNWVVCVKDCTSAKVDDVLMVTDYNPINPEEWFAVDTDEICSGMPKSHFRPATPEEIKEQEMKIMDEKKADDEKIEIAHIFQIDPDIFTPERSEGMAESERQTFTVGGREFYVGQTVWSTEDCGMLSEGDELEVLGTHPEANKLVIVRKPGTWHASFGDVKYLTTTKPKPHEWKFGDWARRVDGVVVFVASEVDDDGDVLTINKGKRYGYLKPRLLTYISTAEIPE